MSFNLNPGSLKTRVCLLYFKQLQQTGLVYCFIPPTQAYLWHNNEAAVEWIESQMSSSAQSTLTQNLECVRKDRVLRQVQAYVSHTWCIIFSLLCIYSYWMFLCTAFIFVDVWLWPCSVWEENWPIYCLYPNSECCLLMRIWATEVCLVQCHTYMPLMCIFHEWYRSSSSLVHVLSPPYSQVPRHKCITSVRCRNMFKWWHVGIPDLPSMFVAVDAKVFFVAIISPGLSVTTLMLV